ncbi:hypothetical protein ACFUC1_12205 [Pedococcus sp. NPDC057267]|uniref:hypothetical protein n=1 Tax=Pedococcus sp. NPDC057267 TaxID=3346077 RepID=UPI0036388DCF
MSFVFMVLHWPHADRRDELARSMLAMRDALLNIPGCVAVDPPYLNEDGQCLVGISRWESKQAFLDSGITLLPDDHVVEGETRPRQRFLMQEALAGAS